MNRKDDCIKKFKKDNSFRLGEMTINNYERATEQLFTFFDKPFDEITARDIRKWVGHLDSNGYKPTTIKTMLFGIQKFYSYCVEEEIVKKNPVHAIAFPKIDEKVPKYLTIEELTRLRKLVEGSKEERAVIETLYATGIRISELASLRKDDINWSERIIHIREGKRKKGRIVLFTPICSEHLRNYLDSRNDSLPFAFVHPSRTKPIIIRTHQLRFSGYAKKLEIHFSAHTLRHTFAAHLAMKGMPLQNIQALLGHQDPRQTHLYARLYSQAQKEKYDEWM